MAANAAPPAGLKDFTVVQLLGKGSYGSVFKATRKSDGFSYAIKEINIRKLNAREREDAVNEIRILASIKHRNIVRYCDAFVERDNLYIVMEYAEHGDIGRQVEKFKAANKYIKEDTIWSYAIQIAQGLHSLHSKSVLHRDIKPKNVFLTGKNHVRLGDLGCAKLMKGGLARTQIGTPYYMSPEIWHSRPYDAKSDMWALGCLVYEMAMLSPPFLAADMNGLAAKVKTAAVPRISKHYSDALASLVSGLLDKDPRGRPDAKALLCSPAVIARMALVPTAAEEEGPWVGEELRSAMIATIRVPFNLGVAGGRPTGLNLPAPCYPAPQQRKQQQQMVVEEAPAAAASAAVVAPAPTAPVPTAARGGVFFSGPAPSSAAPHAQAPFAGAVTSPPRFGLGGRPAAPPAQAPLPQQLQQLAQRPREEAAEKENAASAAAVGPSARPALRPFSALSSEGGNRQQLLGAAAAKPSAPLLSVGSAGPSGLQLAAPSAGTEPTFNSRQPAALQQQGQRQGEAASAAPGEAGAAPPAPAVAPPQRQQQQQFGGGGVPVGMVVRPIALPLGSGAVFGVAAQQQQLQPQRSGGPAAPRTHYSIVVPSSSSSSAPEPFSFGSAAPPPPVAAAGPSLVGALGVRHHRAPPAVPPQVAQVAPLAGAPPPPPPPASQRPVPTFQLQLAPGPGPGAAVGAPGAQGPARSRSSSTHSLVVPAVVSAGCGSAPLIRPIAVSAAQGQASGQQLFAGAGGGPFGGVRIPEVIAAGVPPLPRSSSNSGGGGVGLAPGGVVVRSNAPSSAAAAAQKYLQLGVGAGPAAAAGPPRSGAAANAAAALRPGLPPAAMQRLYARLDAADAAAAAGGALAKGQQQLQQGIRVGW